MSLIDEIKSYGIEHGLVDDGYFLKEYANGIKSNPASFFGVDDRGNSKDEKLNVYDDDNYTMIKLSDKKSRLKNFCQEYSMKLLSDVIYDKSETKESGAKDPYYGTFLNFHRQNTGVKVCPKKKKRCYCKSIVEDQKFNKNGKIGKKDMKFRHTCGIIDKNVEYEVEAPKKYIKAKTDQSYNNCHSFMDSNMNLTSNAIEGDELLFDDIMGEDSGPVKTGGSRKSGHSRQNIKHITQTNDSQLFGQGNHTFFQKHFSNFKNFNNK